MSLSENNRDCSFKKIVSTRNGPVAVRTNISLEKAAKKLGEPRNAHDKIEKLSPVLCQDKFIFVAPTSLWLNLL